MLGRVVWLTPLPHPAHLPPRHGVLAFGRLYILSFLMLLAGASAEPSQALAQPTVIFSPSRQLLAQPTASFDFINDAPSGSLNNPKRNSSPRPSATSPGLSTGGGGGSASPFAFTYVAEGATESPGTGPSAGVGGSGTYYYAEAVTFSA